MTRLSLLARTTMIMMAIGGLSIFSLAPAQAVTPTPEPEAEQARLLDPQATIGTFEELEAERQHARGHHTTGVRPPQPDASVRLLALDPATGGRWSRLSTLPEGTNAYHMIMGPGGKILLIAGSGNNAQYFEAGTFRAYIWSPTAGITRTIDVPEDMFCAGHMLMSNGQGLAAGGTKQYREWQGSPLLYSFDFATERFTKQADMANGRWYPTLIGTPGGQSLIVGGLSTTGGNVRTAEVYNPNTRTIRSLSGSRAFPLYPKIYTTSDRRYFFTGEGEGDSSQPTSRWQAGFWDPFNGNTYTTVSGLTDQTRRFASTSCRIGDVRRQNLVVMGGGWPATSSVNIIKLNVASPAYRVGPSLPTPKAYLSCLALPDGSVLQLGGGTANEIAGASREVSLLRYVSSTSWRALNPLPEGEHRLYHSMAFMLDDGSVISMSSNPRRETRSNTVLRYEPAYFFKGTRPTLSGVPATMAYGGTYSFQVSADVTKLTISTAPSPTHGTDANLKQFTVPVTNGRATMSVNTAQFGKGPVRIFALNDRNVPSTALWSRIQ